MVNKFLSLSVLLFFVFQLSSCSLLNSGTVHVKYTSSKATFDDDEYENVQRLGQVSASIRNVQHPSIYGKWNINVKLRPSIHLDNIRYATQARREDDPSRTKPNMNLRRLSTLGNLKFSLHTPVGAFVLSGGFGGQVYKQWNNEELDTVRTNEIRKIDLAYIAFFSKRIYLLMGPRYYRGRFEQYIFAFRIGYYWGPTSGG